MRKPAPVITRFLSLHIYVAFTCLTLLSITRNIFAVDSSASATQAIMLAQKGRCREALPLLKKSILQITDKQARYQTAMLTARCAMSLDQTESAVRALLLLNREYPRDPDVLYTTTHFYSELASRASQELASAAPNSPQAQQLEAEAFESQGNWEKAAAQYKQILEQAAKTAGIHYRLFSIVIFSNTPYTPHNNKKNKQKIRK